MIFTAFFFTEKLSDAPKLKASSSIKDLLEFIEGTDAVCKNEKKAAKKARQFERKVCKCLLLACSFVLP